MIPYRTLLRSKKLWIIAVAAIAVIAVFSLAAQPPQPATPPGNPADNHSGDINDSVPVTPPPTPLDVKIKLAGLVIQQSDLPAEFSLADARERVVSDYTEGPQKLVERGWIGGYLAYYTQQGFGKPQLANVNSEYTEDGAANALEESAADLLREGYVEVSGTIIGDDARYLRLDFQSAGDDGKPYNFTLYVVAFIRQDIYEYVGLTGLKSLVSLEETQDYARLLESRIDEYYK